MGKVIMSGIVPQLTAPIALPSGNTRLTYIEGTGTQYIDTGLVMNKSDSYKYVLTAKLTNDSYGGANGYMQFTGDIVSGAKAEITIEYDGSTCIETIYVNGSVYSTKDWTSSYSGENVKIGILKLGDASNTWYSGDAQTGQVYACKIYSAGALVRNFVPCLSDADGIGLFDVVNSAFHGNAGSGVFIGSEVS